MRILFKNTTYPWVTLALLASLPAFAPAYADDLELAPPIDDVTADAAGGVTSSAEEMPTAPPPLGEISTDAAYSSPAASTENVTSAPRRRSSRDPYYTYTRPAWGVEITGSLNAFGGQKVITTQTTPTRAFQVAAEYQLPMLQDFGVFSVGPSAGFYPIFGSTVAVTSSPVSIWDVGGQIRYQGRFFHEQIIVPVVGFEAQIFNYRFNDGPAGKFTVSGPIFGAMLLLNFFERSSAAEMYVSHGISRSYLVAELKSLQGGDEKLTVSGTSIFFGLRLEF